MMNDHHEHCGAEETPADLAQLARALDALAEYERGNAGQDFESRVMASVRTSLRASAPTAEEYLHLRTPPAWGGLRFAAAIALGALVIGASWVAVQGPQRPARFAVLEPVDADVLASDIEQFLNSGESWDLGVADDIAVVSAEIQSVGSAEDFWGAATLDLEENTL